MQLSPTGKLIITFDTTGSIFEVTAGLGDVGVMKVEPSTGNIISGKQLGSITLAALGANGSNRESISSSNFAFDGNLLVVPFRTISSLVETNPGASNDAGYFVLNEDLSVNTIKQLGSETYSLWVAAGNYNGSISGDNQFRGVVINGPGDYLFFGKTSDSTAEPSQLTDFFFARYVNHSLVKIVQYGASTMPSGTNSEEPRFMQKMSDGKIYCMGHTRSSLFEPVKDLINPVIFRVNADGEYQNGIQLGATTANNLGLTNVHYTLIQGSEFVYKDGRIVVGANNDPVTSGTAYNPVLWGFAAP